MICRSCKSNNLFIIESKGNKSVCRNCGYEDQFRQPKYDNYHKVRYTNKINRNIKTDPLLAKIIGSMTFNKLDKVLDYGCGTGDYTFYISKICKYVIGLDIDVSTAKRKFRKKLFKKQVGLKLNFPDSYFDKIICVNVIEHIHDYDFLLKEFKRILKLDGKIFITTYNYNFIFHSIHNDPTHVIEWDDEEFKKIIGKFFFIDKAFKYGTFFNCYPFNWLLVKFLKPEICIIAHK